MAGEKTEKATPKKRNESRKEGQVARTAELGGWISLFLVTLALPPALSYSTDNFMGLMNDCLRALEDPSVDLSGDTQVLVDLQNIFADLRLDSEAELARWIGPVAAHAVGQLVRTGRSWSASTRSSLETAIRDYLTEETRHLVGRREADSVALNIHELRLRLDRLEARVHNLQNPPADSSDV